MITEIIKELVSTKNNIEVTSEQVLMWVRRVELQGSQTAILENLKENSNFVAISRNIGGNQKIIKQDKADRSHTNATVDQMQNMWIYTPCKAMPSKWQGI